MKGLCKFLFDLAFEYETPKVVMIRSIKIGMIYRFLQLIILAYVIGWVTYKI